MTNYICGSCGKGARHNEGRCMTCGGPFSPPSGTLDRFGARWPSNYDLCPECKQPDNCGDCNHGQTDRRSGSLAWRNPDKGEGVTMSGRPGWKIVQLVALVREDEADDLHRFYVRMIEGDESRGAYVETRDLTDGEIVANWEQIADWENEADKEAILGGANPHDFEYDEYGRQP